MEIAKEQIRLEFIMNTSPSILYSRLSTPSGLSEWFCDDVHVNRDTYTFIWDGSEQSATLLAKKRNEFVRFQWNDDDEEESYFEFSIVVDDITDEIALIVIDYVDSDERDESEELWESQINALKHVIGS